MVTISVYSKKGCPFCSLLKAELNKKGLEFEEIDLSDDSLRQAFYQKTGFSTVPQLYIHEPSIHSQPYEGTSFGGWTQVSSDWNSLEKAAKG